MKARFCWKFNNVFLNVNVFGFESCGCTRERKNLKRLLRGNHLEKFPDALNLPRDEISFSRFRTMLWCFTGFWCWEWNKLCAVKSPGGSLCSWSKHEEWRFAWFQYLELVFTCFKLDRNSLSIAMKLCRTLSVKTFIIFNFTAFRNLRTFLDKTFHALRSHLWTIFPAQWTSPVQNWFSHRQLAAFRK